ncbi:hypothetical protein CHS0354_030275 [Potamilus streckersoni]|uniref:beta-N-acetylhexosaminidase n=1 Tax=Potamilus streckersoni TaxID=2493646 RepID=A0AAE0RV77_9BIVA|nr:hypothetical protein CHS0354_030275 [Potamilus streckersoni]
MDQSTLDTFGETLGVKYQVIDNLKGGRKVFDASITLTNNAPIPIQHTPHWAIYFCHVRMIEPGRLPNPFGCTLDKYGVKFSHINGCLFKLEPTKDFKTLKQGDSIDICHQAQYYSVAKTDAMPNWYMTAPGLKPVLIKCTVDEEMKFVQPFDLPCKWKRFDYVMDNESNRYDQYDPFTVEKRLQNNVAADLGDALGKPIIPTPLQIHLDKSSVSLKNGQWIIIANEELLNEANYLADKLGLPIKGDNSDENSSVIVLKLGVVDVSQFSMSQTPESYWLEVDSNEQIITITGCGEAGVFYGIQTLLSLHNAVTGFIPQASVIDSPRYPYRGMHLDVSRNFHSKDQVLKLLEVMAIYKMNKFHFHLSDDEGWRLEIPGLEELTEVGAKRGHSNSENYCLLPLLGSGPNFNTSGTGHYTVSDYREIVHFAKQRHIEVIPEIDLPGHSYAAIYAMKARYYGKKDSKAEQFLLADIEYESSDSRSVQMFTDNVIDPGLENVYRFIDKVVEEIKNMHKDINPLRTFHIGGDEVPHESWRGSLACQKLVETKKVTSFDHIMEYFVTKAASIVAQHDLDLGAWQDGVIHDEALNKPVKRTHFKNKEVFVYAWQNVWESGLAGSAYRLANHGYKVVMSQGTHLYFDHPYEPDPEERGLYWAARYIDTHKTFSFMPDNIYANADVKLTGEVLPADFIDQHEDGQDTLKHPENIVGMQGQLWSELVRLPDQMDYMIFPRLLALAERAWHKAPWEKLDNKVERVAREKMDWEMFANALSHRELLRLDDMNVAYHIPPPGARVEGCILEMNCSYPGLPMFYSLDEGNTWIRYIDKVDIGQADSILFVTKTGDTRRTSRQVHWKKGC